MTEEAANVSEIRSEKRSVKSLPWVPSTQLTMMFHASALVTVTLGVLILLAWNLLVADPKSFTDLKLEFATSVVQLASGLLILSGVISLFVSVRFSHRVTGPMVAMRRHVEQLIEGDFSKRVQLRKNDEFKDLAERLNVLTEKLQNRR